MDNLLCETEKDGKYDGCFKGLPEDDEENWDRKEIAGHVRGVKRSRGVLLAACYKGIWRSHIRMLLLISTL